LVHRLIRYAENIFGLTAEILAKVRDGRLDPRIPTLVALRAAQAMFWARLGSLNALESLAQARFWKQWLGQSLCSVDTIGRVHASLDCKALRGGIHRVYERLKRNKALPLNLGRDIAVLDGHESHASYRRHCPGCLQRAVRTKEGDRVQFYHRNVTLMLLAGAPPGRPPLRLLLDVEPQRPGEDELGTALRLLGRVLLAYPRAFDLVLADALYATAPFFNFLLAHHKHALVVLKDERRNLYQDVQGLFELVQPQKGRYRSRECLWWDFPDLVSWPEVDGPVRVIRSLETYSVRQQRTGQFLQQTSDWIWVTTLSPAQAWIERAVQIGHQRWDIENHGFNELVNGWHADHVYKHHPTAIEAFLLAAFLAYNIFHAFLALNLKPQVRRGKPQTFWARLIAAELYSDAGRTALARSRSP
jgi:hypothetical protein